jgi:hypothetical protein
VFYATENLTPGTLTPFANLLEHQRFASHLAWSAGGAPDISISPDARAVTYKDKTLDVGKWQNGLRRLHEDIKKLVEQLLHGHSISVNIPENTPDNMAESAWGYSWIHNGPFTEPHALLQALMQDKEMKLCTVTQHGELVWNVAAMMEWMLVAKELNTSLCVETHCVPGQVSRASELCDGRIINGLRGRNLFRIHGSTWWVNRRVKSEHLVHHESFIPVKFPPEMEEVLHTYLLVIRPVEIEFARHLWGQDSAALYNEYMWVTMGHRLMEERFSRELQAFSQKYFDCALSVRPYRQIVVALSRTYLGSESEIEEEEDSDALVEQRGHSIEMSRSHYGRRIDRLQCLTDDVLTRFGRVSEAWWRLVGFFPGKPPLLPVDQRRQLHMAKQSANLDDPTNVHQNASLTPAFNSEELLAMMRTMVDNALTDFGTEMKKEIRTAVASGMAAFLDHQPWAKPTPHNPPPPVSIPTPPPAQHPHPAYVPPQTPASRNFGTVPSEVPLSSLSPITGADFDFPMEQDPLRQADDLLSYIDEEEEDLLPFTNDEEVSHSPSVSQELDSLALLRELLSNDTAIFKSQGQKRIVDVALAGDQNLIAVMRTGGGKSMSYMIPAYADQQSGHGMTIVVIPNKVLLADVLKQTAQLGLKSSVWLASEPMTTNTPLVLMAVETVTSPKFHE